MSIAGGIEKAFYAGASIDCTAIQVFTHSNRQWAMKTYQSGNHHCGKRCSARNENQTCTCSCKLSDKFGFNDRRNGKKIDCYLEQGT